MTKLLNQYRARQEVSRLLILLKEETRAYSRLVDECWETRGVSKKGVSDATRNQWACEADAFFEPRIAELNTRIAALV